MGQVPAIVTRISPPPRMPRGDRRVRAPMKVTRISPQLPENVDLKMQISEDEEDAAAGDVFSSSGRGAIRSRRPLVKKDLRYGRRRTGLALKKIVEIPRRMTGRVMGRHGLVLKGIEGRSNTEIDMTQDENDRDIVIIYGASEHDLNLAAAEIQAIIDQVEESALPEEVAAGRGAFMNQGKGRKRRSTKSGDGSKQDEYSGRREKPKAVRFKIFSPSYREQIYETYKSNPEKWTIEALCDHFQVVPGRMQAMLTTMKYRERYLEENKDVPELTSRILEDVVIRAVGEEVTPLPPKIRPLCKAHFRFVKEDSELAKTPLQFNSIDDELDHYREVYREKMAKKTLSPKPQRSSIVKKVNGLEVIFPQETKWVVPKKEQYTTY